ncbi:MAG: hypothetical protein IJ265_06280 [Oscillospiraceae bacterium]|nr:hypothetical protein [Oscillospiraceae bacterium]
MNAEMIIEKIRDSIENYEEFKEIALDIRFRKAEMQLYSWYKSVLGIEVYLFRFADGINEDNIVESIVQCRLMKMAEMEEWKDDFWDVSRDDRLITLNVPSFRDFDLIIKEVRLIPLDTEEYLSMVKYKFSGYEPSEDTFPDMADTICDIIRKSQNIELGGFYALDHKCLSVSDDTILIVEYGVWD